MALAVALADGTGVDVLVAWGVKIGEELDRRLLAVEEVLVKDENEEVRKSVGVDAMLDVVDAVGETNFDERRNKIDEDP